MTVPPWFGWEAILLVLVLLVVVAVAFFVASAASPDVDGRSEWQAGLDARSQVRREALTGPDELRWIEHREGQGPQQAMS
jgi:hypothetical protein